MIFIDKTNFDAEVLGASGLILVDFWSPKCETCQALDGEISALAEKYDGKVKFCKINVLENRRLAISQKVLGLPVVALYRGGQKVRELVGEIDGRTVEEAVDELLA
jgi:thioredoxin 1